LSNPSGNSNGSRWFSSAVGQDLLKRYADKEIDAQSFMDTLNATYPVFMLTKEKCPFCRRAKKLLDDLGAEYTVLQLDELPGHAKSSITEHLKAATGAATVPRVFVDGVCLGGFSETQRKLWNGDLVPLLVGAGSLDPQAARAVVFDAGNPML
jgi:glutaredoxin 3